MRELTLNEVDEVSGGCGGLCVGGVVGGSFLVGLGVSYFGNN